jgi:hypothetical protein
METGSNVSSQMPVSSKQEGPSERMEFGTKAVESVLRNRMNEPPEEFNKS